MRFCVFVLFRHKEVVRLLRRTGAHFSREHLEEAGSELCRSDQPERRFRTLPTLLGFLNRPR